MDVRKNIYDLTDTELALLQQAIYQMKANGKYDDFVMRHHLAAQQKTLLFPGEVTDRNIAHGGPAFLPWHRVFIREFEQALQAEVPGVTLPYWDWAADSALGKSAPLWNADSSKRIYLGGDGDGVTGLVTTGLLADPSWIALIEDPSNTAPNMFASRQGVIRSFGKYAPTLPTQSTVDAALQLSDYDTAPWDWTTTSFRNCLEGFRGAQGERGNFNHNRVHLWVSGDMSPMTSPNDPVFFLHHCNVDRIWAQWQATHPNTYQPISGGPLGHNLNDVMQGLLSDYTPAQTLDYMHLDSVGYTYDWVEPDNLTATFSDVGVGFTTYGRVSFQVKSYSDVHLQVKPGTEPSLPFGMTLLGPSAAVSATGGVPATAVIWFSLTGTGGTVPIDPQTVTIQWVETGIEWQVQLVASTVSLPYLASVLVLDKSGSMREPAGSTGLMRIEALQQATSTYASLVPQDNAIGVVSFSTTAQKDRDMAVLGDGSAGDTTRADLVAFLQAFAATNGTTAIGEGVKWGQQTLDNAALDPTMYHKSMVVFTDGLENVAPYIQNIIDTITSKVYAIGLGTAEQVSTLALTQLTNAVGGYVLLTGNLTPDTEDYFRLQKYFLQILADLTAQEVNLDPDGVICAGQQVRIPFHLTEADLKSEVILLTDQPLVDLALETPGGVLIEASGPNAPGVSFGTARNMRFGRISLPVPLPHGEAHAGTWHAILTVRPDAYPQLRGATSLRSSDRERATSAAGHKRRAGSLQGAVSVRSKKAGGVRYSVSVRSASNLRLTAHLGQRDFLPGDNLNLRVALTEYGQPVVGRAIATAHVRAPDGIAFTAPLQEAVPGIFEGTVAAVLPGIYHVRMLVSGKTLAGRPFTREKHLTGAVWYGADPSPSVSNPMQPVLQRWPCLVQALVFVGVGILLLLLIIVLLLVIWLITH